MKKLITILIFSILLLALSSASTYSPHEQSLNLEFSITSNNATSCNVSGYNSPDGYYDLPQQMTKTFQTFNATIFSDNFTTEGSYCFNIICTDGSTKETGSVCREVTELGKELSTAKATTYFLIFIFSLLLLGSLLVIGIYLPNGNKKDEMTGYILYVSNIKYLKYLSLAFSYLIALFISYFVWIISRVYLDLDFMTNIFRFITLFMIVLVLPLFIFYLYLNIANLIRDSKIADSLMRGLRTT